MGQQATSAATQTQAARSHLLSRRGRHLRGAGPDSAGGLGRRLCIIAAPTHYSVLLWSGEETWWYYSEHELYSASGWARVVAEGHAGDAQAAFDDRLHDFDRIITASGTHAFAAGKTSIDRSRLAEIVHTIDAFFGVRLSQLDRARELSAQLAPPSNVARTTRDLSSASGAQEVRARLRRAALDAGDPVALRALYCFRTLDLPDLRVYLRAARRGARIADRSATIATIDDAVRSVAAIAGRELIFEDPDRIAMPDETARLGTGTARDKALLLHVLLRTRSRHRRSGSDVPGDALHGCGQLRAKRPLLHQHVAHGECDGDRGQGPLPYRGGLGRSRLWPNRGAVGECHKEVERGSDGRSACALPNGLSCADKEGDARPWTS